MGQTHSVQYNEMVRKRQQQEWKVVEQQQDLQIWQNKINGKRYAVYPFDFNQTDAEQNIQMLHFRKLNHLHLVSAQMILKSNDDALCSNPRGNVVLLQHIPVRLIQINNKIGFSQRLSILASTFAALHTLNFIFGPLFIWEDMIGFNQYGKTKIWINKLFFINEPSRLAKGESQFSSSIQINEQKYEQENQISDKMINCVTQVFKIVGNSQIQTYLIDFRQQAAKIRNFMEGEEFIHNYCRTHNIDLRENVNYQNYLHDPDTECSFISGMSMHRGNDNSSIPSQSTFVQSARLSNRHYPPFYQQNIIYDQPTQRKLTSQQPRAQFDSRSSISRTKVTINYGAQTKRSHSIQPNQHNYHKFSQPVAYPIRKVEIISQPLPKPQNVIVLKEPPRPKQIKFQSNIPLSLPQKENIIVKHVNIPIQPIVSEQYIESIQKAPIQVKPKQEQQKNNNILSQNITPKVSKSLISQESPSKTTKITDKKQEIKNDLAQLFNNNNFFDSSEPQTQKLVSECFISESLPFENQSNYGTGNAIDEIKMWEASLLMKISSKKQPVEVNHYIDQSSLQSLEQDTVNASSHRQSYQKANQRHHQINDMEEYVRHKYKEYINHSKNNQQNIYSFGSRGNQQIKPLFKRQQQRKHSIDNNLSDFQMRSRNKSQSDRYHRKKPTLCFPDIIHEEADRQSRQQSESTMKYGTFGRIEYDANPFCSENLKILQNEQKTKTYNQKKRSTSINDTILEERYKKYVSNKQQSKNISSHYLQVPSSRRPQSHRRDYLNEEKGINSSYQKEAIMKRQLKTPTKIQKLPQQTLGGALTYNQLRQFLRN